MEAEDPVTWIVKTIQRAPEGEIEGNNKICIEGLVIRTVWDLYGLRYENMGTNPRNGSPPTAVTT